MKAQGVKNRCRLSEIPRGITYEVAPPRMALYIEYAADIYSLYLDYFDPQDISGIIIRQSSIETRVVLCKLKSSDESARQKNPSTLLLSRENTVANMLGQNYSFAVNAAALADELVQQ